MSDANKAQISAMILKRQVTWLNKTAKTLGITRNQLLIMLFNGLMTAEKEAENQGSLFKLYQSHLETLLEANLKK